MDWVQKIIRDVVELEYPRLDGQKAEEMLVTATELQNIIILHAPAPDDSAGNIPDIPDDVMERLLIGKGTEGDQLFCRSALIALAREFESTRLWRETARQHLKATLAAWKYEAQQGDGINEEFALTYDWAKAFADGCVPMAAPAAVTLSAREIKDALEFAGANVEGLDEDQLMTDYVIERLSAGHSGPGYYASLLEYPEEGCIKLGDALSADSVSVCSNCDTALPKGCGGLFKRNGAACQLNATTNGDQDPCKP